MRKIYTAGNKKNIIYIIIGIIIFITLLNTFSTIKSGEIGLKVRFGKIVDTSLKEGLNVKIPYLESIVTVNVKVQKIELETESSSKDLQTINTLIAVNYRILSDKASNLYKTVGNEYESIVLEPAIKESLKSVVAGYTAEEVITKRSDVSKTALLDLESKVSKYGIQIENFNITNLSFSEEYSQSIEEKQVAEQKLEKARLEAEAKLVEARATNEANDLLKKSLTDEIIASEFIKKWDGKLPTTYAGDNILGLFNLGGK